MQHTLRSLIHFHGVGLHGGQPVAMIVRPAPANHGIHFVRTDVTDKDNNIAARWDNVTDTKLCTVISNKDGIGIGTIEHLMAALQGCHIDNALIEINGPEVTYYGWQLPCFCEREIERGWPGRTGSSASHDPHP